jgi:hypothetical protein
MQKRRAASGCSPMSRWGDLAQSARDLLTVSTEQRGTAQNAGFLKAPVIVNSLLLEKPERIEALGLVL